MRYGIINWGTSSYCRRVFILQKYVLRILDKLPQRESCSPIFKKLKILTLTNTYVYQLGCFVYKNLAMFRINTINHNYGTRFKHNLNPDQHSTTLYQKNCNGCKIWNALPMDIKIPKTCMFSKKA